MGTKAPHRRIYTYLHIYTKVKKSKNIIFDFETEFADSLESCYLLSFVKLSSKFSKTYLVEGSWILKFKRDVVFSTPVSGYLKIAVKVSYPRNKRNSCSDWSSRLRQS